MIENAAVKQHQGAPKYGSRANNINLLRFIAASMVIYFHMGILLGQPEITVMGVGIGGIAVNIFFILSGYLIASSWAHSTSFKSYVIRRAARIFPALIVVVLVTTFVIGPLFTSLAPGAYFASTGTWKYLSLIFLAPISNVLPGVFETLPFPGAVNGSLWTLRYEFLMYLLVPLLYFLLGKVGKKQRKPLLIAFVVFLAAGHCLIASGLLHAPEAVEKGFRLGAYFFIGTALYELGLIRFFDPQYSLLALFLALIFCHEGGPICPLLMMVVTVVFTIGFSFAPQPKFARCFSKNDFSYGIYIWAFPIQQALVQIGGGSSQDSVLAYSLVAFVITLALAVASWFLVEKPCMDWGKRLSKRF